MKNHIIGIILSLCLAAPASAAVVGSSSVPLDYVDARRNGSLSATLTSLGTTTAKHVKVLDTQTLLASTTVPTNITLEVGTGGLISCGTYTLTIYGKWKDPGARQVFHSSCGPNQVLFGDQAVSLRPQMFGAAGDNSTDDAAAIQRTVNIASYHDNAEVVLDGAYYLGSDLYLNYDASNNPLYNSSLNRIGRMRIRGASGKLMTYANLWRIAAGLDPMFGDTLRFAEGYGVFASGTSSYPILALELADINLFGKKSGALLTASRTTNGRIKRIRVYNNHDSGNGILWEDGWHMDWDSPLIVGKAAAGNPTETGVIIRNVSSAGGSWTIKEGVTHGFATGWEIGHRTYGSGYEINKMMLDLSAEDPKTNGVILGHGAAAIDLMMHAENYSTYGLWIKNSARSVTVHHSTFSAPSSSVDLLIGSSSESDADARTARVVKVYGNSFSNVNNVGIKTDLSGASNDTGWVEIKGNLFTAKTNGVGYAIDLDAGNTDKNHTTVEGNYFPHGATLFSSNITGYTNSTATNLRIVQPTLGIMLDSFGSSELLVTNATFTAAKAGGTLIPGSRYRISSVPTQQPLVYTATTTTQVTLESGGLFTTSTGVTAPTDTAENTMWSITIPGGTIGPNGYAVFTASLVATNNANVKTIKGYLGSTNIASRSLASRASDNLFMTLYNRNSETSQLVGGNTFGLGSGTAVVTASENTGADVTFSITVTKATAGDTVTLEAAALHIYHKD